MRRNDSAPAQSIGFEIFTDAFCILFNGYSACFELECLKPRNSLSFAPDYGFMQAVNFPPRQPLLFTPDGAYATRP